MSILSTVRFIFNHPIGSRSKIASLRRYAAWQIGSRLVPGPVLFKFVNDARLLAYPGLTGATGNVYVGLHEFEDMAFVAHALRPGDRFADVGANVGSYTLIASSVAGAFSIAFEPVPSTCALLRRNIGVNGLHDLVEIENVAVGEGEGTLRFTSSLDTVNHVARSQDLNRSDLVSVPVKSLDSLVGSRLPRVIKIDVEGFETNVIRGASRILRTSEPLAIILELCGSGTQYGFDESKLDEDLRNRGFETYRYSPFERTLEAASGKTHTSDNRLYIKSIDFFRERVATSPKINVHGVTF